METANGEENKTPSYLILSKWKFMLTLPKYRDDIDVKDKLLRGIREGNMAPYYHAVCEELGWTPDPKLLAEMEAANKVKLSEYEKSNIDKSDDDDDDIDDDEPRLWQEKLEYLCSIGDKKSALSLATKKSEDTSLSTNRRLEAIFALFRIAYFHGCDRNAMKNAIKKATELIETGTGGDWSARNKLKAYEAVCSFGLRDYQRAANLLLDAVPTYESYELLDFESVICYTVLSCMIALPRCELNEKFKKNSTLMQALKTQCIGFLNFYDSLNSGRYSDFFKNLAEIENNMKIDPLLHPHYRHYIREMRLKAYSQLLQAYRSISLKHMAGAFGVTEDYIEKEVARFAVLGRLQCKIDRVAGTIVNNSYLINDDRSDVTLSEDAPEARYERQVMYQNTIRHGDILLNRLKKLARVVDF